ncbi:MAG: alpha-L-fucosidase [Clostridia bacterium]|nr:alpha-L-fucosidase [Clostridia bacterium]
MADHPKIRPTAGQLAFMDWEFGAFFHFGIRSFFLGHKDWDNRPMPASEFNPDQLDCGQWIRTVKEAGATYAILVCKHHDGFANWPSKYTDYSVANTPWKNGKGDVVREFVDACRRYGLKVGLYYSPAQWGGRISFREDKEYDDYFINQIGELLTGYGKIDYLWFDGCGSENHEYDRDRIVKAIRGMQPDILIFSMWDPNTRWVGNEDGYAPMPNPYTVAQVDFSELATEKEKLEATKFLPAECDFKMRSTWFDCELNEDTIKTPDELMGIYEMSVGRGANFLVNIGPNRHGLLPEPDVKALLEFGRRLKARYGSPVQAFGAMEQTSESAWQIQIPGFAPERGGGSGKPALVNRVVIMEDLSEGEAVEEFAVYASLPAYCGQRLCLYRGATIGHKAIVTFPTMRTARITVEVTKSNGPAKLRDLKTYYEV